MLPLALLASHLVGDFVFQSRWQATEKFGWTRRAVALRTRHVLAYLAAFAWLPFVWMPFANASPWRVVVFLAALAVLHFLTDAQRFTVTVGDIFGWHDLYGWPTPNPWPALPLAIDQTLHVVQLAALGWLLS
jgi:hypothetical protein